MFFKDIFRGCQNKGNWRQSRPAILIPPTQLNPKFVFSKNHMFFVFLSKN